MSLASHQMCYHCQLVKLKLISLLFTYQSMSRTFTRFKVLMRHMKVALGITQRMKQLCLNNTRHLFQIKSCRLLSEFTLLTVPIPIQ